MKFKVVVSAALLFVLPSFSQSAKQQEIESHSRLAQEFLKNNTPDRAVQEFAAIVEVDPGNVDARGNLGVLLYFQGNYTKAAPELRATLKLRPGLWKIQALLGMCEKRLGQVAGAQVDLEKSFPQLQEEKLRVEAGLVIEIIVAGDLDKATTVVTLSGAQPADILNVCTLLIGSIPTC
jgi:Flp pilus assembly protein TadD